MWCRSISTSYAPLLERHRTYFRSGRTRSAAWRNAQLEALEALVTERAAAFHDALWKDLRRNRVDADVTDVQFIADEAAYARRRLRGWMRPLRRGTPLFMKPGHVEVRFEPFGVGLIVGAWNYPLMLTLSPLVAAICGGNAAVVKPSEVAPACAEAIARLLPRYLDPDAFSVVTGGVPETTALLAEQWDHIFFTGGPAVGKIVMTAAAAHLTPVVLELGGKNPAFVDRSANVRVAARRIAQGRWTNAGQTCTAPDYVLVDRPVAAALLQELKAAAVGFYGPDPRASPDYGRIVSAHHFERLLRLLEGAEVYHGGEYVREELYLAPTILTRVAPDAPAMREEIFGPILPVIEVDGPGDALAHIDARPRSARLLRVRRRRGSGGTHARRDPVGRCRGQRLHAAAVDPRTAFRRGREFRHGQVPRRVGFSRLHQRPRRAAPSVPARPGGPLPTLPPLRPLARVAPARGRVTPDDDFVVVASGFAAACRRFA